MVYVPYNSGLDVESWVVVDDDGSCLGKQRRVHLWQQKLYVIWDEQIGGGGGLTRAVFVVVVKRKNETPQRV